VPHFFVAQQNSAVKKPKGTLFIYLALAKPALPGQFDLLVSSQSKENASKCFVCSDEQHKIKAVISKQHKNILLFLSSTKTFYYLFLSLPQIG
jgi:hypothetical protein